MPTARSARSSPFTSPSHVAVRVSVALLVGLMTLGHVLVIVTMRGGQILYIHPVVPLLSLAAGAAIQRCGSELLTTADPGAHTLSRRYLALITTALLVMTTIGWKASSMLYSARDHKNYSLLPHSRVMEMSSLQNMKVASDIASMIREDSMEKDTVFGQATISALVGLLADRKVAGQLADLDPRWVKLGMMEREEVATTIETDGVTYFITPRWFWVKDPYFNRYLRQCYSKPRVFPRYEGSGIPDLLVFKHTAQRPCIPDLLETISPGVGIGS